MSKIEKKEVVGNIVAFTSVLPDLMDFRNSKLATFSYFIDGKYYISENSIPVPMRYGVGNTMTIKYNVEKPTEIFPRHYFVI
ncbi:hypothetical protein HCG82_14945 [Enterococcus faecium]|uniref:hypothetical protein n=1 Tax=Enterococcus TaxID=1350 RepID=UPI001C8C72B7|nr:MULTISPECIES: hypothetical protein [Enterococcus]MBX9120617.1 hypothetical protein [Enterococcus faecium]MBX9128331.1 hypothetical protein [Enterococcus casseliflavus]